MTNSIPTLAGAAEKLSSQAYLILGVVALVCAAGCLAWIFRHGLYLIWKGQHGRQLGVSTRNEFEKTQIDSTTPPTLRPSHPQISNEVKAGDTIKAA